MTTGIVLVLLGFAGATWGAMPAFDLRGAATRSEGRRHAARARAAARTGDLGLLAPSVLGTWFFRLCGALALLGAPCLVLAGLVVAID
ncbi:hypothetical protein ACWGBV_29685 [Streptomyces sp. NPDC055051]